MKYLVVSLVLLLGVYTTASANSPVIGKAPGVLGKKNIHDGWVLVVYSKDKPRQQTTLQVTHITAAHIVGLSCSQGGYGTAREKIAVPLHTISYVKHQKKKVGLCPGKVKKQQQGIPTPVKVIGAIAIVVYTWPLWPILGLFALASGF